MRILHINKKYLINSVLIRFIFTLCFLTDFLRAAFSIPYALIVILMVLSTFLVVSLSLGETLKSIRSYSVLFSLFFLLFLYSFTSISWSIINDLYIEFSSLFSQYFFFLLAITLPKRIKEMDLEFFAFFSKCILSASIIFTLIEITSPDLSLRYIFPSVIFDNYHSSHSFYDSFITYHSAFFASSDRLADMTIFAYLFIVAKESNSKKFNFKSILFWTVLSLILTILTGRRSQMIVLFSFSILLIPVIKRKFFFSLLFIPLATIFLFILYQLFGYIIPSVSFIADGVMLYGEERFSSLTIPSIKDALENSGFFGNGIGINSQLIDSNNLNWRFESGLAAIIAELGIIGLIVYILFQLSIFFLILKTLLKNISFKNNMNYFFVTFFLILNIFILLRFLTQYAFFINPTYQALFWLLMGLQLFFYENAKNNINVKIY